MHPYRTALMRPRRRRHVGTTFSASCGASVTCLPQPSQLVCLLLHILSVGYCYLTRHARNAPVEIVQSSLGATIRALHPHQSPPSTSEDPNPRNSSGRGRGSSPATGTWSGGRLGRTPALLLHAIGP